ncbi:MAG: hypothetical protein BAJATHORv1_90004 [Candidatus Thorarchaeota archaeon]|nr:MAG: hypothetical protein BAJATHORv1_90004 [Candidatus Thorarchaeota archaeon]
MPFGRQRYTAFRVTVADLKRGIYNKDHIGHLVTSPEGLILRRVMVAGLVIDRFATDNRSYAYIMVDDTTGYIRLRG